MQLEGEVMGYSKKTLATVAVLVLIAGGAFYAGAKYEKSKLMKLNLLGNRTGCLDQAPAMSGKKKKVQGTVEAPADTVTPQAPASARPAPATPEAPQNAAAETR